MLKLVLATLSLAACATTGFDRETASQRRRSFELTSAEQTRSSFPQAIDPQLPSVDRIARIVQTKLGNRANAEVELCVSNDGRVTKVTLVQSSDYKPFDVAVIRDVEDWEFTARQQSTTLRRCKRTTISYRSP